MTQAECLVVVIARLRDPDLSDPERLECLRDLQGIIVQVRRLEKLLDTMVEDAMQNAPAPGEMGQIIPFLGRRREVRL